VKRRTAEPEGRALGSGTRWLLAGAFAWAMILAFPPTALWPVAFVMMAPLAAAIDGARPRTAFALTYAGSVAMALWIVRWLVGALAGQYGVAPAAAWLFTVLLVCAYAFVPSLALALYAALRPRLPLAWAPLVLAALYVGSEWLRATPLGLPWLLAGETVSFAPRWIQAADLGGVVAVGFPIVAFGAGLGLALRWRKAGPLMAPVVLLAAVFAYGTVRLSQPVAVGKPVRVGIVQASIPQEDRFVPGSARVNVLQHANATLGLAAGGPLDLVVWSETAVDDDLDQHPELIAGLSNLADRIGAPLLTGAPRDAGGRYTNSVVLFVPGLGLAESYDKQRLVPFAEMDPPHLGWLAPLLGPVTKGAPYAAGHRALVFRDGPVPFSTPVCFEITYPGLVRRFREAGAELLVNLSNDAWFGRTGYARMHLGQAALRAVELDTWVVRGANTGISAVVDPRGRVVSRLGLFKRGTLRATVYPAGPDTVYGRVGDGPVLACLGLVALAPLLRRRQGRDLSS
jgi:apolipoprotein N-acyltransferase